MLSRKKFRDVVLEARNNSLSVQQIILGERDGFSARAMNADRSPFGADYPDGARASREIVVNLFFNLVKAVSGRDYFNGQVGWAIPELLRYPCLRNPVLRNERNVGRAHGVRI